jgi:protein ImuB
MFACVHSAHGDLFALASSFSPAVERTSPGTVVFSIAGLGRLMGTPHQIAAEIGRCGAALGIQASLAMANNPDTAVLIARNQPGVTIVPPGKEADYIGNFPIEALATTSEVTPQLIETFERWGIRTLAALAELPEIGLAERFGEAGVHLRRLALGRTQRVLRVTTPETKFEKRVELDHPLELLEPLLFVFSSILNELLNAMRRLSLAANRIHLGLELENKSQHERILEFPAPIQDAPMLLKILQLDLEAHPAAAAITAVRIELNPVPPQSVQHGLFLPSQPEPQKLQLVLTRIAGLVGEPNVGSPSLLDSHRPDAFAMLPFRPPAPATGEISPRASLQAAQGRTRPPHQQATAPPGVAGELRCAAWFLGAAFRMFRPNLQATVRVKQERPAEVAATGVRGTVLTASGPWRSAGEWWTETRWVRDAWDIDLSDGGVYRIYLRLDSRCWFVEGVYD